MTRPFRSSVSPSTQSTAASSRTGGEGRRVLDGRGDAESSAAGLEGIESIARAGLGRKARRLWKRWCSLDGPFRRGSGRALFKLRAVFDLPSL